MNYSNTIVIDGLRYHKDRPASCRRCYFWKNHKVGCTLGKRSCWILGKKCIIPSPNHLSGKVLENRLSLEDSKSQYRKLKIETVNHEVLI